MSLAKSVLEGNRLALAQAITQVENDTPEGRSILNHIFSYTGNAYLIGVTGPPGTGKSSLVNQLASLFRQPVRGESKSVAIIAVDPSSPFTGGALLGDRIRMRDLAGDSGVFIRSMASRGSLGGLATTTSGVAQLLDAAGYQIILIETVGAGQAEVDIARLAHSTLVVEAPGLGDDIQAIKAGILEIADILVINKADRPGVEIAERALKSMLNLAHPTKRRFEIHSEGVIDYPSDLFQDPRDVKVSETPQDFWVPPIQRTIATEGEGIPQLVELINQHRQYLLDTGELERRDASRLLSELDFLLRDTLIARWNATISRKEYENTIVRLLAHQLSPRQAVEYLLDEVYHDLR